MCHFSIYHFAIGHFAIGHFVFCHFVFCHFRLSGTVCLSILNAELDWKPSLTVRQILGGIQLLLDDPNVRDPAQAEAYATFVHDKPEYERRVKAQVDKFRSI